MKKIKGNKKEKKAPMNPNTKILLYVLVAIVALVTIILILVEGSSSKIVINNKTDLRIESLNAYFQDSEDMLYEEFAFEDIKKGSVVKKDLDKMDFSYSQATLRVAFEFEGQKEDVSMFVDAGYFNDSFNGKITIDFSDTEDGNILLKVKASSGVIPNPNIICDEEYIFNLEEGEIE